MDLDTRFATSLLPYQEKRTKKKRDQGGNLGPFFVVLACGYLFQVCGIRGQIQTDTVGVKGSIPFVPTRKES
ncbi:MAG: hypothetical protein CVU57_20915 [Deltaproteobacteria bacterium HGW-Deltaproteobacteria-15]|nr:MAG: hypothetical protein CVU57_20915 [Deltaproteobacteria bacterium HGW-Deltaproteobacteria-15]PKN99381.1 MAG: hypothetical protein CVU43_15280 [Chloroflexi bacterium HGW-Chloroflexi-5]